jgi:hypothetical protein
MPIVQSNTTITTQNLVPDLYVVIVPPSQLLLNGVASNVVGLVGTSSWGPVNTPVSVSSMANYSEAFGQLNNRKYDMGTHAGVIAQQAGTAMQCVRVTDGTDAAATAVVGSTDITFTAKYTGTQGDNVTVVLQNGAKANTIAAVVSVPGYATEIFQNISAPATVTSTTTASSSSSTTITCPTANIAVGSVISGTGISGSPTVASITDSTHLIASAAQTVSSGVALTFTPASYAATWTALANAINNGQNALRGASSWITATAGSGVTLPSLPATYNLAGGSDGVGTITASVLVGDNASPPTGMYALGGVPISILDVCDADDSTQWTTIDAFAVSNSCYAVQVLPAGTSVSGAVTAKRTAGLDSAYSKLMHGDWLYWNDPVNQVTRLVSPQAFAAGRLSNLTPQNVTLNKTIYGVAGSQKSGLGGVNQSVYSTADLATLIENGIDVVTNPGAGGLSVWTCRSGHNSSTNITIQLDSYATLTNYIAKTLEAGMGFYIGQEITPTLFQNITATLTQFMQNLTGSGFLASPDGSTPYAVQCNKANNPDSLTKIGVVTAAVQAEYPSINQTFIVNLQGGSTITVSVQNNQG